MRGTFYVNVSVMCMLIESVLIYCLIISSSSANDVVHPDNAEIDLSIDVRNVDSNDRDTHELQDTDEDLEEIALRSGDVIAFTKAYQRRARNRDFYHTMKIVDRNGDGTLEWKEYHLGTLGVSEEELLGGENVDENYVREMAKTKALWSEADQDGDGILVREEAMSFLVPDNFHSDEL